MSRKSYAGLAITNKLIIKPNTWMGHMNTILAWKGGGGEEAGIN